MLYAKSYIAGALLAGLCVCGTLEASAVISTFENGIEGWGTDGDSLRAAWNPDLHAVVGVDQYMHGMTWYFVAPTKYHGNHSDLYGTYLTYDFMTDMTSSGVSASILTLAGGGIKLRWFQDENSPNPIPNVWTNYSFILSEAGEWVIDGTDIKPTHEQFMAVLSDIIALKIRGEFSTAPGDVGSMRNVIMGAAPVGVPEPASAAMLALAGGGLLWRSRKK